MLKILGDTNIGKVRSTNQDALRFGTFGDGNGWALVCDGMGGPQGGNIASELAVNAITRQFESAFSGKISESSIKNIFESALNAANMIIYEQAQSDSSLSGMGTTAVAAVVFDDKVFIANVGDSRAYIIPDGSKIEQLTVDHSVVQILIQRGEITPEQAATHPQRHYITNALGIHSSLSFDFNECLFGRGDVLLLCSDGLYNHLTDDLEMLVRSAAKDGSVDSLIKAANDMGGTDNITAVLIVND